MNYAPELIGVGKYTTELAAHLASRHHHVEVISALPHYPGWTVQGQQPWRYQHDRDRGVRVTRCPLLARGRGQGIWRLLAPLSFAMSAAPVVVWRILRTRPHCVLCVEPTLFCAPAALLAARLIGARTVLHVQDLEVDAAFATGHLNPVGLRGLAHACERAVLGRFDQVVTICDGMAVRLQQRGVPRRNIAVIRNWIDPAAVKPVEAVGAMRASLGIAPDRRVVLYAGHLGAKQGLGVLIDALQLVRNDPGLHAVIAGAGPMSRMVRAAAASLPNLTVIGLQPPERLGDLLAMADIHVLPQDAAAGDLVFPSKLGALLATGTPIVVTADPGTELSTWLHGAATIVPAGDAGALAAALRRGMVAGSLRMGQHRAAELAASSILPMFEAMLSPVARKRAARPFGLRPAVSAAMIGAAEQPGLLQSA